MTSTRTNRTARGIVVAGAALVSLLAASPALAQKEPDRARAPYVHAPELRNSLCGSFAGTIVWSSGASYDCSSGDYSPGEQ